jgi:hypothetical protein
MSALSRYVSVLGFIPDVNLSGANNSINYVNILIVKISTYYDQSILNLSHDVLDNGSD